MTDTVRFVGRLAQVRKGKIGIIIPESVLEDKEIAELLNKWYKSKELLIIEIKKLHGMIQR